MFEHYKSRMAHRGANMSEMLRMQSNMVVEQTWDRDPNYRRVYVVKVSSGLPKITDKHELIDVKFNIDTYHKITSDEPAYLLQLDMEPKNAIQTSALVHMFIWQMKMANGSGGLFVLWMSVRSLDSTIYWSAIGL